MHLHTRLLLLLLPRSPAARRPADFYKVNPAFGTQQELLTFRESCRQQNVAVLFDMVYNHVGYGDFAQYNPFNATSDFHDCDGAHGRTAATRSSGCSVGCDSTTATQ